jgi:hypothetical protein
MHHVALLAAEATHKLGLTGHIRGVLIVITSITLFCGSIYLLLATNLGARLGFLVAAGGLTGFLMLLSALWSTSQVPLNSFHGIETHWTVKEVRPDPSQSFFGGVRDVATTGHPATEAQAGDIKATADTALTTEGGPFNNFQNSAQYISSDIVVTGGGRHGFLNLTHRPLYAVVKVTPALEQNVPFGAAPPPPAPDPTKAPIYVILVRNLGSIRLPQYATFLGSAILFGLCLLGMHRLERARADAAAAPVPAT